MTIQEAKQKANKDDEAVRTLLEYIGYLETRLADRVRISEEHQKMFGQWITEDKER